MKKIISLTLLLVLGIILVGCSGKAGQLTRADVQKVNEEGNYEDVIMITDQEKVHMIRNCLEKVSWKPNTKAEMARKEDIFVTLFYTFDKNMPERLYEYRIWFNKDETATIVSSKEKEGYGTLDKENSQNLKDLLSK